MSVQTMSYAAITEICCLNKKLLNVTGIDFAKEVINIANNEKKTEIDLKNYLRSKIDKNFSPQDAGVFIDLYFFWVDFRERESEAKLATLGEVVGCDNESFRSRYLKEFLIGMKQGLKGDQLIAYCDDVVGFFEKS